MFHQSRRDLFLNVRKRHFEYLFFSIPNTLRELLNGLHPKSDNSHLLLVLTYLQQINACSLGLYWSPLGRYSGLRFCPSIRAERHASRPQMIPDHHSSP